MLCPYCKTPIHGVVANLPRLSARQFRVFKAVLEAGETGIERHDLLVRMYADDEWPTPGGETVLRVIIHSINKRVAKSGLRIEGKRMGGYRLIRRGQ